MTKGLILAAVILLSASVGAAEPDSESRNEAAIRSLYASYDTAWSKGDAKALATLWTDDADHVEPDGRVIHGRAALEQAFAQRFSTDLKGSRSMQTVDSIRFITPDVAVVDASYTVTGAHDLDGKPRPIAGRYLDIWINHAGIWRIAIDRPTISRTPR